ncbi:MAG: hypothetical protein NTW19_14570 [Planctomycetota bacterium]|nr:hypothetical protein [Planctomycetota bacterium]
MHATSRAFAPRTLAALLGGLLLTLAVGCQEPNSLLRRQGMEALWANDVARADNRFTKAVKQDPTDWKSQYYVGVVRIKQGQALEAQLVLEKALTLRPREGDETQDILDSLAESIYAQNQPANLSAMLQKAADEYGTVRDYTRQGTYLGKIGDVDGAKLAFRKAIKMAQKDDPQPFIALADYLESAGDTQGAIRALKMAYSIMPRSERLAERFRHYGIVPGPTVPIEPER